MKHEIKVPAMGESINEATIAALLKTPGSAVKIDDELIELSTDKVNQVLYAPEAGVFQPTVKEEDAVKIGQVIGYIDTEGSPAAQTSEPTAKKQPEPVPAEKTQLAGPSSKMDHEAASHKKGEAETTAPSTPPAKGARISQDDYLAGIGNNRPEEAAQKPPPGQEAKPVKREGEEGRETRRKISKIRKIIGARLVNVMQNTAMLTTFNEVDMTPIMATREKHKEAFAKQHGVRLGLMSFFVKASTSALQAFPDINSYIDGEEVVHRNYFDIGIAVGTERGLVVPVLKDCDQLSMAEIEQAIEAFGKKAREGTMTADELQGGGFTITNGGVYGSLLSTPILNPPQCGILGMHKIMKRPVVIEDEIAIRQMMYLALSYDHRLVDGKTAVSFLVHLKNHLEDPVRFLLEI